MDAVKLKNTIDILSRVISVPESKQQEIIDRCTSLSEKDVIKILAEAAFRVLGTDEEMLTYCLEIIRKINPDICPSVEEMKIKLHNAFSNVVEGNMSLEDNHRLVRDTLVKITNLFNQHGIDYYIVGALPCFIKTGQPLFRYHDDIDIMVNEADLPKVAGIIKEFGYEFHDDRFPSLERFRQMQSHKPPHTVLAQNPNNEFHIGFFTFRREQDQSITMREYSHRMVDDQVVVDVLERRSDSLGTALRYDDIPTEFMGASFRTSTTESVYALKSYTRRPKDITDMERLEPYIDKKKLEELSNNPNKNVEILNVSPHDSAPKR